MLKPYQSTPIEVEVADFVRGATRYKQKVINRDFSIRDHPDGSITVTMPLEIQAYAIGPDGSYGERMPHADRTDTLVSESTRAVDPQTGQMRYRQMSNAVAYNYLTGEEETIPLLENGMGDWCGYLEAKPEPLRLQGQFLAEMHDTQPVFLRPLREQYIRDADAEPSRFA